MANKKVRSSTIVVRPPGNANSSEMKPFKRRFPNEILTMIAEKADDLLTIRNLRMASRITEIGATKTLFRSLTKMPTAVGVQDLKQSIAKDHRLCHRVQSLSLYASDDIQEVSMNDIYAGPVNLLATNMQEKFPNLSELTVKVDDALNDLLWDKSVARIAMQSLTEAVSLSKAKGPKKLHLKAEDHCFQPENFNAQGWPWDHPAEFLSQFTELKIDVNCCSCDPGVFIYDKLLAQSNHLVKLELTGNETWLMFHGTNFPGLKYDLPSLKDLSLSSVLATSSGLLELFKSCRNLERLYLSTVELHVWFESPTTTTTWGIISSLQLQDHGHWCDLLSFLCSLNNLIHFDFELLAELDECYGRDLSHYDPPKTPDEWRATWPYVEDYGRREKQSRAKQQICNGSEVSVKELGRLLQTVQERKPRKLTRAEKALIKSAKEFDEGQGRDHKSREPSSRTAAAKARGKLAGQV